jgi:hypothetical protein
MHDVDVRIAVRRRLRDEHLGDDDTRIVEEMGIWNGAVRIDLAVINGELAGYELKSARDTLARLPAQAALYNTVFDRVHLVAAEKHIEHALSVVPDWWGIIVACPASTFLQLELVRSSCVNVEIDELQLARLLWRDEALSVLASHDADRGVRSGNREKIADRLAGSLPVEQLRYEVRRCLKVRSGWLRQSVGDQPEMAVRREA